MIIDTPNWDLTSLDNITDSDDNKNNFEITASTVYEPAEDTFLVLDALQLDLERMIQSRLLCQNSSSASLSTKSEPLLVVELGSGAGLLTAAVAKALNNSDAAITVGAHCIAVDINLAACHATAQTCRLNGVQVDVIRGDLLTWMRQPEPSSSSDDQYHRDIYGPIDILLFNPPYVRGQDGEPAPPSVASKVGTMQDQLLLTMTDAAWLGGGPDGVDVLKRALHYAANLLSERGMFYILMIDYNYAALVRDEMHARSERDIDNLKVYQEDSNIFMLTTFGDDPMNRPLACRKLLSRHVPGERLAVYQVYRPHVSDSTPNKNVEDSLS